MCLYGERWRTTACKRVADESIHGNKPVVVAWERSPIEWQVLELKQTAGGDKGNLIRSRLKILLV